MATVSFKKGLLANLPATKAAGTFYVTTDERAMYLDVDGSTRIRLGDFQEFANTTALTANHNPSTTALYYVTDINCLAKWNGSEYIQINKDTGMTSIEVTGNGNAVTAAVYDASGRKLTLTKGATYMTAADVDGKISDKVGAIEGTVKAYVDEKTSGIASDAALTELAGRVTTAEGKIIALEDANKEVGALANAIADAQATANQAVAAAAAAQADVDSLEKKVGTVPADKTVIELITAAQTQADKGVTDAAAAKAAADAAQSDVDTLEGKVGTVPNGKTVVGMIAEAQAAATYDDTEVRGLISDNANAIADVKSDVDTFLAAADIGGAAVDTLKEIQDYISTDGAAADQMVKDIAANKKAIEDEAATARAAEAANATAASEAKSAAATAQAGVDAIKADYLKAADKTELQGNIDGVSNRVKAIEDKNISNGANKVEASTINGNIKIDGTETVVYTHPATHTIAEVTGLQAALDAKAAQTSLDATNVNVTANAEDIADLQTGKADKATTLAGYGITDAYTKSETYTQAEVNALLTWGEF